MTTTSAAERARPRAAHRPAKPAPIMMMRGRSGCMGASFLAGAPPGAEALWAGATRREAGLERKQIRQRDGAGRAQRLAHRAVVAGLRLGHHALAARERERLGGAQRYAIAAAGAGLRVNLRQPG